MWITTVFGWIVYLIETLWELLVALLLPVTAQIDRALGRLFAPLVRARALRRARQLDELAEALERAGMPAQAAQISACADRWRRRAAGVSDRA